jgi:hypothetical protein
VAVARLSDIGLMEVLSLGALTKANQLGVKGWKDETRKGGIMKNFIFNLVAMALGIVAVVTKQPFLYNVFWVFTVVVFLAISITVLLCIFFLHDDEIDTEGIEDVLIKYNKKSPILRKAHYIVDWTFLIVVFGCGHFVLGALWFMIHVIFDSMIKVKAEELIKSEGAV